MIDLYYWTTPNGHKITIFLEESGLEYNIKPINISQGDQFKPEFLAISPNNRIPAIVDHQPSIGGEQLPQEQLALFESGAILEYLADKIGRFLPARGAARYGALQWLYWQMGGLGPMAGQNHHFSKYAPEKIPYAIHRYVNETNRLYGVLNKQLKNSEYMCGDYSIVDMACYPWIRPYEQQGQNLEEFPDLKAWFEKVSVRPAVQRAYALAEEISAVPAVTEEGKKILFGQKAR